MNWEPKLVNWEPGLVNWEPGLVNWEPKLVNWEPELIAEKPDTGKHLSSGGVMTSEPKVSWHCGERFEKNVVLLMMVLGSLGSLVLLASLVGRDERKDGELGAREAA